MPNRQKSAVILSIINKNVPKEMDIHPKQMNIRVEKVNIYKSRRLWYN